jgi:hypothetical protein
MLAHDSCSRCTETSILGRRQVFHRQFPIPIDKDAILQLCRRVLTEVYSMRRGDDLDYHFLTKSDVGS